MDFRKPKQVTLGQGNHRQMAIVSKRPPFQVGESEPRKWQ